MSVNREFWILMKRGRVQWFSGGEGMGVLFATSRDAALNSAKSLGTKARPALVGTVQGETLETVLADSFDNGANAAFVVDDDQRFWRM